MRTIWKFPLDIIDEQVIDMPKESTLLSVADQNGTLCLWAEVDPDSANTRCRVWIQGTGNPLSVPVTARFLGTVIMSPFVWHVYVESK